jgi:hypothetical protein
MRATAPSFRTLLIATTAAASAALALAPAVANASGNSAKSVTVKGTFQHLVADGRASQLHLNRDVVVSGTKMYDVKLPKGTHGKPGTTVTVTGTQSGSTIDATQISFAPASSTGGKKSPGPSPSPTPTPGSTAGVTLATSASHYDRVLVILATWTQPDSVTQAQAQQQFFGADNTWFNQVSYGAYGLTGDVTPWVTIAGPDNGLCLGNSAQVLSQAEAAALADGFNSTLYDRTVVYFPSQSSPDCSGYAGWSYQPGNVVWLNGAMDLRTTVHEQGHNLGLGHAHADVCQDAAGSYVTLSTTCQYDEYGDAYDAMGASGYAADYSAGLKSGLGWGNARAVDLTAGGTAVLSPIESTTGTPYITVNAGSDVYYVETRAAVGPDAQLPSAATDGVIVHQLDPTSQQVGLLDMTPDGNFSAPALRFGGAWGLPNGMWLNVGSPTSAGVPVSVTAAPLDVVAPHDVTGVSATVRKGQLTLAWTNPTDPDLAKINVVVTRDGSDPRLAGTASYSGLGTSVVTTAPGATALRFVITATDTSGNVSTGVSGQVSSTGKLTLG